MDFGDILDDWDKRTAKPAGKKAVRAAERELQKSAEVPPAVRECQRRVDPLTAWLRTNPIQDKDSAAEQERGGDAAERRRRLRTKAPDAAIDLHGLTRDEAWTRLSAFFADAKRRGLEKLLIVHGKGNHSEGEAVLKRTTRQFIERCAYAGESGTADNRSGGNGATWVLLKF